MIRVLLQSRDWDKPGSDEPQRQRDFDADLHQMTSAASQQRSGVANMWGAVAAGSDTQAAVVDPYSYDYDYDWLKEEKVDQPVLFDGHNRPIQAVIPRPRLVPVIQQ